jgi:hypothetical protein
MISPRKRAEKFEMLEDSESPASSSTIDRGTLEE